MNELASNIKPYEPSYDPYDDNMHENPILLQYWQAALRHKLVISAIIVLALAAGFIITLLTTPYFTATSRLEINREQDKVTNIEGVEASDSASQSLEFYQTQYALLEARSLAERVVRVKKLSGRDDFFAIYNIDIENDGIFAQNNNRQSATQRNERLKLAVSILQNNISIVPVRGSSLVDISFSSPDPDFSAEISNSWAEEFIASNLDRRFNSTADARKLLEEQLDDLRQKLEVSELNLNGYADTKQIITISEERNSEGKTISKKTLSSANLEVLNNAYAQAIADRILAQSAVNQASNDPDTLANSTLNRLREERATAQAEYDRLLVQFEPEYPVAKSIASQIASLNRSISAEVARSRNTFSNEIRTKFREAVERENKLKAQVDALKNEFGGERRDAVQFDIFQREVDTNRQLYESLLQRYKEIGVAGVSTNNISIVDTAQSPDQASSPIMLLNLALALLSGLFVAGAYVFIREQLDQSVKDPADMKSKLGIASLGSIPDIEKEDILESLLDKKSVAWEAYLSIRTSLSFLTDHGVPKSFLLTSSQPNEGKSTSAFALAAVLASNNNKILLLDGDMRNPSIHKMIALENKGGLSNYLSGNDNVKEFIVPAESHGFDIMAAGPIPPNAAELLSSERLQQLIRVLGEHYDTIIIDAPPVLGLADIPILANSVEGVIYTVEAGRVKLRAIQSAIGRIRGSNATIFGGILTKVPQNSSGYGYAYQYSYGQSKE